MAPFIGMVISFLVFRSLGLAGWEYMNDTVISLRFAAAVMLLIAASAHWGRMRPDLIAMVPPRIPKAGMIVSLTGIFEITGAFLLLFPSTTTIAATLLALLLIAMFPANMHAARHKLKLAGRPVPPIGIRTVIQIVFIAAILIAGWLPSQG
ncbi:hypothetical protein NST44_23310 [Paenibacillus sp. FSL W8-0919]|uniref:DoxX family protein n=1 Tax=Paenibacillus sp. FSL W8-0919 TaxID=2954707 RepID=UPI0030F563B3